MTNDITTLNGALQELGEIIASNLVSMGVSASAGEGLTTLANKITDIQSGVTFLVAVMFDDGNDADGIRPASASGYITGSDSSTYALTISSQYTDMLVGCKDDLDLEYNGSSIAYSFALNSISDYSELLNDVIHIDNLYIQIIVLHHTPNTVTKTLQIVWNDNNNSDGIRPHYVDASLTGGGESYRVVVLDTNWEASLTVQKKDNGTEINYSWTVQSILGYTVRSTSVSGDITTITLYHRASPTPPV